jgi:hypothetical protein
MNRVDRPTFAGSDGAEMIARYRTLALRSDRVTLPRTVAFGPVGVAADFV